MSRGLKPTLSQLCYQLPPDLARQWRSDASTILLSHVWQGYDLLCTEVLSKIDTTEIGRAIETGLTQYLAPRIQRTFEGFEPYCLIHEFNEYETQKTARGRPPQYDMAFVWNENERFAWPLEAKDLSSDNDAQDIKEYAAEINENFVPCRYAPFSSEAAMVGYLLTGEPAIALTNISQAIPCAMTEHTDFLARHHQTSDHPRSVPEGKSYPAEIRIHHLIMDIAISSTGINTVDT